nr:FAD:protein FMN transferase [Ardenticatena sp.]
MRLIQFRAMGCHMEARLDTTDADAARLLARVPHWFEEWEQVLSRFRTDSELSRLNAAAGQGPVPVSPVLWDVLQAALAVAKATDGLVTPTILPALQQAGYTTSFEQLPHMQPDIATPAPDAIKQAAQAWREIRMNPVRRTVYLPPNAQLDFGGVAKGWAAEQAAKRLGQYAPALVDAGGDIAISGPRRNGQPWLILVASPFDDTDLDTIASAGGVVATSGREYRRWLKGARWQHHIIDPRTGRPAETDVVSVTIIARTALRAELATKMVLILGAEQGMQWLELQRDLAGLVVREDGTLIPSRAWQLFRWHHRHVAGGEA